MRIPISLFINLSALAAIAYVYGVMIPREQVDATSAVILIAFFALFWIPASGLIVINDIRRDIPTRPATSMALLFTALMAPTSIGISVPGAEFTPLFPLQTRIHSSAGQFIFGILSWVALFGIIGLFIFKASKRRPNRGSLWLMSAYGLSILVVYVAFLATLLASQSFPWIIGQ